MKQIQLKVVHVPTGMTWEKDVEECTDKLEKKLLELSMNIGYSDFDRLQLNLGKEVVHFNSKILDDCVSSVIYSDSNDLFFKNGDV